VLYIMKKMTSAIPVQMSLSFTARGFSGALMVGRCPANECSISTMPARLSTSDVLNR
jgi:hypothetical protein